MNRIFRNIRMSSLRENRVGRYLLYALGEIILVIIGILIALQINNLNEQRKNERRVTSILINVQRDLYANIEDINGLKQIYENKDSLITLALSDSLTEDDYMRNPALLMLLTTYSGFECKDNSYENLVRNSEIIPNHMAKIIPLLDELYLENASSIKQIQEEVSDMVMRTLDTWSTTKTWYLDLHQGRYNPEFVEFFLHDPYYKNSLVTYQIYTSGNILKMLRQHELLSVQVYKSIHEMLGSTDSLPPLVADYMIDLKPAVLNELAGTYQGPMGITINLYTIDDQLSMQVPGQQSIALYAKSDSVLFNPVFDISITFGKEETNHMKFVQNGREFLFNRQKEEK